MNSQLWIIGCGDIGHRVAKLYKSSNIQGIVRSKESAHACQKSNIQANIIDFDQEFSLPKGFPNEVDVFYFMPPPSHGVEDTRLDRFLNIADELPRRIVLISTTGVYGDSKGEWLDEDYPTSPVAERAHRRLSAEKHLKQWAKNNKKEFIILRVPGIYAHNRLPTARLEKGLAVVIESEAGITNRIHADDLAQACKAAMESKHSNEIINVTDGNPSTMTEYFNQVADFTGLPRPPQISMSKAKETLSVGMVSYLTESRRISNAKMLKLLNIKLKYPNLASTFKT